MKNYENLYKDALNRAREYKKYGYMMINAALDNIFPELKENKGEWIEKQGENPTDKLEPKFHEGELIINPGSGNIYQVVAIIDNQYQLKYGDNYAIEDCTDVDRCARLCTQEDFASKLEQKLPKKIEKDSKWSEEDERLCNCLIKEQEKALDDVKNDKYGHTEIISDLKEVYNKRIKWLKSLKDRV